MPKIFLRTVMAGPAGVWHPGWHVVDEATAAALLAGGFAVGDAPTESARVDPPETAALPRPTRRKG